MPPPRVFVSSSYYDLRHVRSEIERFVKSVGFEPVLFEKGSIPYIPESPIEDACSRDVETADIFVLIVGGRYGSSVGVKHGDPAGGRERYDSITRHEYRAAVEANLPVYVLVDRNVYSEYETFDRNRDRAELSYGYVDSANVFEFLDEVRALPASSPMQQFQTAAEIEEWLRGQWAGLFRSMLKRRADQARGKSLSDRVDELKEINATLRRYLESLIEGLELDQAGELIQREAIRLDKVDKSRRLQENNLIDWLVSRRGYRIDQVVESIDSAESRQDFAERLGESSKDPMIVQELSLMLKSGGAASEDLAEARRLLGKSPLPV